MSTNEKSDALPTGPGCVACIGVFDGVHQGHRQVIGLARAKAHALGLRLVAVTFDPHPMGVVGPRAAPTSLASLDHRVELLLEAGADEVDVLTFDHELADLEPEEFITSILVDRLGVREVVVGENFRFGHRAAGTVTTLERAGEVSGFAVTSVPLAGTGDVRWSSTYARSLVAEGDVVEAAEVLARPYRLDGIVVHGDHRGRELGYPTANLQWSDGPTIPADGVYAGAVLVEGEALPAAISVGTNPQFDGRERRVEAYVLDRNDLDLYGRPIGIEFVERIRGQATFDSVDDLVARMGIDVDAARETMSRAR